MADYSASPSVRRKIDETIDLILGLEKAEDVSVIGRLLTA